jgi:microcystin-dependent protein
MSYNGSGTFNRVYSWAQDKINNIFVRADRMDTEMDGFATGLSTAITRDGQSPATANLPMGGFHHTNVSDGTSRNQYAAVGQMQDGENTWGGTSIGAADAYEIGLTPSITAYSAGLRVSFISHQTNVSTSTLSIDGLATKTIQNRGAALGAGNIRINTLIEVEYDGTNFQLTANYSPTTTRGDLIVRGASLDQRLAVGAANTVLKSDGTDPSWGTIALANLAASLSEFLVPTGTVLDFAGSSAPTGFLLCFGQAVSRTTYAALFTAISTTYGVGDGSTTFNLPDVRGRLVAGKDDMGGTSANRLTGLTGGVDGDILGGTGGAETHTLTTPQIPSHIHSITSTDSGTGAGNFLLTFGNLGSPHTVNDTNSTGGGGAHNNVQPTIIMNKMIKI